MCLRSVRCGLEGKEGGGSTEIVRREASVLVYVSVGPLCVSNTHMWCLLCRHLHGTTCQGKNLQGKCHRNVLCLPCARAKNTLLVFFSEPTSA